MASSLGPPGLAWRGWGCWQEGMFVVAEAGDDHCGDLAEEDYGQNPD